MIKRLQEENEEVKLPECCTARHRTCEEPGGCLYDWTPTIEENMVDTRYGIASVDLDLAAAVEELDRLQRRIARLQEKRAALQIQLDAFAAEMTAATRVYNNTTA